MEVKNDLVLMGTLLSVDMYLNVKLTNVTVVDSNKNPQIVDISKLFYSRKRGEVYSTSARGGGYRIASGRG